MKPIIQSKNDSFNRLEELMSQLNDAYKVEETLRYWYLINSDFPDHIDNVGPKAYHSSFDDDQLM